MVGSHYRLRLSSGIVTFVPKGASPGRIGGTKCGKSKCEGEELLASWLLGVGQPHRPAKTSATRIRINRILKKMGILLCRNDTTCILIYWLGESFKLPFHIHSPVTYWRRLDEAEQRTQKPEELERPSPL
jgi:hypothetical protein